MRVLLYRERLHRVWWLCLLALLSCGGWAQTVDEAKASAEQHMTRWEADYVRELGLDAASPDLRALLARCALADRLYWLEEEPFERTGQDSADCHEQLEQRFADEPEAVLYLLAEWQPEDSGKRAAAWLEAHPQAGSALQRARLQAVMAGDEAHVTAHPQATRDAALAALSLLPDDETVRLLAARATVERNPQASLAVLLTPGFTQLQTWQQAPRLKLALEFKQGKLALQLLESLPATAREALDPLLRARIHEQAGNIVQARGLLFTHAMGDTWNAGEAAAQLLKLETRHGDSNTIAVSIPLAVMKAKDREKAMQQAAAAVLERPEMLWVPPLRTLTLIAIPLVLLLMCVPLLPLLWIHHRGLARRLAGRAGSWPSRIRLRHAAWATVALLFAPMLALLLLHRPQLVELLMGDGKPLTAAQLTISMVMIEGAMLLVLAPLLLRQGTRNWLPPVRPLRSVGLALLAWVGVFGLFMLNAWIWPPSRDTNQGVMEMIEAGMQTAGFGWTWLAVAVLVPLVEEIYFRGILLRASAHHISFGWANFWQALFFAIQHDAPALWPAYIVFGMAAGWVYRRTGSLALPILMHAVHNSLVLVIFWYGRG